MSKKRSGRLLVLRMVTILRMNHRLASGIKILKRNGNTTILLFSLEEIEILHQERRIQVNTMLMECFKSILFHKQHTINQYNVVQTVNLKANYSVIRKLACIAMIVFFLNLSTVAQSFLRHKDRETNLTVVRC